MSSLPESRPSPRYGSPAQLAIYVGLSVKTIRRLVDAGKVRRHKVGRRVLIPFEDMDRHILRLPDRGSPDMQAVDVAPPFARDVDARGRLIPMTEAEVKARAERIALALDALDDMGDEDEQRATLDALAEAGVGGRSLSFGFPS